MTIQRATFLRQLLALTTTALAFPYDMLGKARAQPLSLPAGGVEEAPLHLLDLHCHPPLKGYLWGKKFWRHHPSKAGANIANMQVDIHRLEQGQVRGLTAVHYLPERGLVEEAGTLRNIFPDLRFLFPLFVEKLEHGGSANYRQVNTMMDEFEEQIRLTNLKHDGVRIRLAKCYTEFKRIMDEGDIAVAHAIEGAHALGRELPNDEGDKYLEHLDYFIDRGVCMMTLAHFFENDVVALVEGIPPAMKKKLGLSWKYDPDEDDKPLTAVGQRVVEHMLSRGMVVDLTHSTPAARNDVYRINQRHGRPLVFSHTGVRHLFRTTPATEHFQYMAPDDAEIRALQACGGVIGIIFMNFWLSGCERHADGCTRQEVRNGIEEVMATMAHIREVTGTYDNIAIGSDLDGLADAPHDLRDHSCMATLRDAIHAIPGITRTEEENILYRNSLRVLEHGWRA